MEARGMSRQARPVMSYPSASPSSTAQQQPGSQEEGCVIDRTSERFVFVVGQAPFESPKPEAVWETNSFCSLVPLLDADGELADLADFPNCGLVWWMLRAASPSFAQPGRLVTGRLEHAHKWIESKPDSMYYQVEIQSVDPYRSGAEILTVPTSMISGAGDLLNRRGIIVLDHPPTSIVFTRWNGFVYGPWRVSEEARRGTAQYALNFTPELGSSVYRIPQSELEHSYGSYIRRAEATVTDAQENPSRSLQTRRVRYELIAGEALERIKQAPHPLEEITSDEDALRSLAKSLMTRTNRQQFAKQLDLLVQQARTQEQEGPRLEAALRILERQSAAIGTIEEVARGLIGSGLLDAAIQDAKDKAAAAYVEDHATKLYADVVKRSDAEQQKLADLVRQRESADAEIAALRARAEDEQSAELAERRKAFDEELHRERTDLDKQARELGAQRELVGRQLTALADRFSSSREQLIQDFLAMRPLLEQVGISSHQRTAPAEAPSSPPGDKCISPFPVPLFEGSDEPTEPIAEEEFFDRFLSVIAANGFEYRRLDLINFHTAVKTNDLTLLGGFSGTGKSSLVDLYGRACAGSSGASAQRFLPVWVSPSWLDSKDLLGQVNALSQCFQPSESRLFEFVARAQVEWERRSTASGVYLVCLDEMNLAQVEHYFGAFLQALPSPSREVPVFDQEGVKADSVHRPFATLRLSPALRFVGTINYDETTRPLSLRLLDRADEIRLSPPEMAMVTRSSDRATASQPIGRAVCLRDFQSWTRDAALSSDLGAALDELRPLVERLGCPLTPRRFRAIRRFVASATPLCSEREAFDLETANRILPQVRNVLTSAGRDALESLRKVLDRRQMTESLRVFDAAAARAAVELGF